MSAAAARVSWQSLKLDERGANTRQAAPFSAPPGASLSKVHLEERNLPEPPITGGRGVGNADSCPPGRSTGVLLFAGAQEPATKSVHAAPLNIGLMRHGVRWAFHTSQKMDCFLNLVAGIMIIVLGFWTGGQFLAAKASTLLIFVGIWTLFHGVMDIIRAFRIKHLGQQARTLATSEA